MVTCNCVRGDGDDGDGDDDDGCGGDDDGGGGDSADDGGDDGDGGGDGDGDCEVPPLQVVFFNVVVCLMTTVFCAGDCSAGLEGVCKYGCRRQEPR